MYSRRTDTSLNYPEIIIYSVNLSELIGMMNRKEYDRVIVYLLGAIDSLKKAGADFAAMSANTPHLVFDALVKISPLPLVSIVEATCEEVQRLGLRQTRTDRHRFYHVGNFLPGCF